MASLQRGPAQGRIVFRESASDQSTRPTHECPPLDPSVQALIGEKLRLFYAELLTEPIPPKFLELIDSFIPSKKGQS